MNDKWIQFQNAFFDDRYDVAACIILLIVVAVPILIDVYQSWKR